SRCSCCCCSRCRCCGAAGGCRASASGRWNGCGARSPTCSCHRCGALRAAEAIVGTARDEVLVLGGGAVGLACALALLDAGRTVRVLERDTIGAATSHGNCGTITPSHAPPLTEPGTLFK